MGANFGPLGRVLIAVSGFLVAVGVLVMLYHNLIGGFMLGGLLTLAWATIVRLAAFAIEGRGVIIHASQIPSENPSESADEVVSSTLPEPERVSERASPAADVGPAVSRIIGADARRRVMFAEATTCRDNLPRNSEPRGSDDRDFADFLRSTPF